MDLTKQACHSKANPIHPTWAYVCMYAAGRCILIKSLCGIVLVWSSLKESSASELICSTYSPTCFDVPCRTITTAATAHWWNKTKKKEWSSLSLSIMIGSLLREPADENESLSLSTQHSSFTSNFQIPRLHFYTSCGDIHPYMQEYGKSRTDILTPTQIQWDTKKKK